MTGEVSQVAAMTKERSYAAGVLVEGGTKWWVTGGNGNYQIKNIVVSV